MRKLSNNRLYGVRLPEATNVMLDELAEANKHTRSTIIEILINRTHAKWLSDKTFRVVA